MNENTKVYSEIPEGFSPQVEVAAIYVNLDGKILLLQLAAHKQESGCWGVPAGKLEMNEQPLHAAKRELFEETSIDCELEAFQTLGALYIRKPEIDYVYHLFGLHLDTLPSLSLSAEHCTHVWVSKEEARSLPLMNGAMLALDAYYHKINKLEK
jgi:phosphatase NudJ